MEETLVTVHSILRWLVLLSGIAAAVLAGMSVLGRRPWDTASDRASLLFPILLDIEVLLGALIWIMERRWETADFTTWGHPILMLAALALAHIGRSRAQAARTDKERGSRIFIAYVAALVIVLAAVPYAWPL